MLPASTRRSRSASLPLPHATATALALLAVSGCRATGLPSWANPEGGIPIDELEAGGDGASTSGDAALDEGGPADAATEATTPDADDSGRDSTSVTLPPAGAPFDYQIGGAYEPPAGTQIVSRDREVAPAEGLYNICYVNGFQAQPHEEDLWLTQHPELVLRDAAGDPVVDVHWNEMLLDVGSADKRIALADIVGAWIAGCARDGYDAVEIDNLDSYARSGDRLQQDDAVAYMALLAGRAHAEGLAIAQKNAAELTSERRAMGTDFAVAEECNAWNECDTYTAAYADHVLVIEYTRDDFEAGCRDFPDLSIVLRDLDVSPQGANGYVHDGC